MSVDELMELKGLPVRRKSACQASDKDPETFIHLKSDVSNEPQRTKQWFRICSLKLCRFENQEYEPFAGSLL